MRMLDQSTVDELLEEGYEPISKEEALEYLEIGQPIGLRLCAREFYEIVTKSELNERIGLKSQGVYEYLDFYIKL